MNPRFSRLAAAAALPALICGAGAPGHAQPWRPDKPVELVIGANAGGAQDKTGRTLQKVLQEAKLVATPVTMINKGGGNGAVGFAYVNQHPGDGHYLIVNSISLLTNHITGKSTIGPRDFTPVAVMGVAYIGLLVRAESPLKSAREVLEALRRDPASLSVAIGLGTASTLHITFVAAMKKAGIDVRRLKTVGFNSGGEATAAVLGGHVDVTVSTASNLMELIRAGRLRMLVIGAPQRLPGEFAQVATWRELGIDVTQELWRGLAGPRGMSAGQIQFWDRTMGSVVQSEDWKQDLEQLHMTNVYKNSAETGKYWGEKYDEAKAVLIDLGLAR